jgi:hypothetical protein
MAPIVATLIEGLGVDHTGCPSTSIPANQFGPFIVLPLTAVDGGTPFDIVVGPSGLITAVEGDASPSIVSHLGDAGLEDVRGMFADAPPADPAQRNAFAYVLEYANGGCDVITRTGSQVAFEDPGRDVSALAVRFALEHHGYMSLTLVGGYWRETVVGADGRTYVDNIYLTSDGATDLLGLHADLTTPCEDLADYLSSEYPYGASQYMAMASQN